MTHSSLLFVAHVNFAGLFFIAFFFLCVCHYGNQLFGIGYHLKIFRSHVATGKKLILRPADTIVRVTCFAEEHNAMSLETF